MLIISFYSFFSQGTLILPTGDKIEGHFSGSWNEGLKINGTFIKSMESQDHRSHHSLETSSKWVVMKQTRLIWAGSGT